MSETESERPEGAEVDVDTQGGDASIETGESGDSGESETGGDGSTED